MLRRLCLRRHVEEPHRSAARLPLPRAFPLTAAETRLALRLLAGQSLRAAAGALGISYESARGQLKSIFRKTGTHRQGELIALLARTPGWLDRQDASRPAAD